MRKFNRIKLKSIYKSASGFTLLEVMVAVAIMGLALVVILQLFSIGLKTAYIDGQYSYAIFLAKAKMGELLIDKDLEEGSDSGTFENGYDWAYTIEPFERPVNESTEMGHQVEMKMDRPEDKEQFKLFSISLIVSRTEPNRKKLISFKSLRLIKVEKE